MARNIAVSDEVYELLARLKLPRESFSHAIRRLATRPPLSDIAGSRTITKEQWAVVQRSFATQMLADRARRRRLLDSLRK